MQIGENFEINVKQEVIMKTARVEILNLSGKKSRIVTALLDTGAKRTYITREAARALGLDHGPSILTKLNTFGTTNTSDMYTNKTTFAMKQNDASLMMVNANICKNITGNMVKQKIDLRKYSHIWKGLNLADEIPSERRVMKIDLLIGNDYYEDVVKTEKIEIWISVKI